MQPILIAGVSLVHLALLFYGIGIFKQRKAKRLNKSVMTFLTMGIIFDIAATVCMISGSSQGMVTLHGIIGYSSLLVMSIDILFSYRKVFAEGLGVKTSIIFNRNSTLAYFYWILAYITGAILVALNHMA